MNDFYVTKGEVIRIPIHEDFYNYIRRVFAWEQDRFSAFQATLDHELSPLFIDDWTGSLWGSLYHSLNFDMVREKKYHEDFKYSHLDFLVRDIREDGTFAISPLGNRFSDRVLHYFNGYKLTINDVNKKFFIMCAALGPKPSKEGHNARIKAQIKELESRLVK